MPALLLVVVLVSVVFLQSRSAAGPQTKALFFGDSLFAGTGVSPKAPVQPLEVARRLGWEPTVDAFGGTGYTTGGKRGTPYLHRLQTDGKLGRHYDVVVLEGGTNDALFGDLEALPDAVVRVVALVRERQPGARIVMVGGYAPHDHAGAKAVLADRLLAKAAEDLHLQYVSQFKYHDLTTGFLAHDQFHPGRKGYSLMAQDMVRALRPPVSSGRPAAASCLSGPCPAP